MNNQTIFSDFGGNLIYVSHFGISTGEKNGFYTLRAYGTKKSYTKTEHGTCESCEDSSVYVRNLSTDKEQAIEAARAHISKHYPSDRLEERINFDLDEIARITREESERRAAAEAARVAAADFNVFQYGKHAGKTVEAVYAEDKSYLEWFSNQSYRPDTDAARTQVFAKAILAPERAVAAEAKQGKLLALKQEIGEPELKAWYDGEGGAFLRSIANDLKQGVVPRGRGLAIVLEILAKWAGRTGSKAFKARLAELQAKFA